MVSYQSGPAILRLDVLHTTTYYRHIILTYTLTGERTPVGVRLAEPPANVPEHWMMCKSARSFQNTVASVLHNAPGGMVDEALSTRRVVERFDGSTVDGEW